VLGRACSQAACETDGTGNVHVDMPSVKNVESGDRWWFSAESLVNGIRKEQLEANGGMREARHKTLWHRHRCWMAERRRRYKTLDRNESNDCISSWECARWREEVLRQAVESLTYSPERKLDDMSSCSSNTVT